MRDFIKQALTKTIQIRTAQGDTQQLKLAPDKKILYDMYFALADLVQMLLYQNPRLQQHLSCWKLSNNQSQSV